MRGGVNVVERICSDVFLSRAQGMRRDDMERRDGEDADKEKEEEEMREE